MSSPATHPATPIAPASLCLVAVLLILFTLHLCWLLASAEGHIDWCNPYWADCVSVSRTGRAGSAYFLFKGGIISTCVLLGLIWQRCALWLHSLGNPADRLLPVLGWAASLALLLYTLSLGHAGDTFRLLRRTGVVLFIALSFFCFVRCGAGLLQTPLQRAGRQLLGFCAVTLTVALISLLLDAMMGEHYQHIENAFEWWLLLLLNAQLLWLARLWQQQRFTLNITQQ